MFQSGYLLDIRYYIGRRTPTKCDDYEKEVKMWMRDRFREAAKTTDNRLR